MTAFSRILVGNPGPQDCCYSAKPVPPDYKFFASCSLLPPQAETRCLNKKLTTESPVPGQTSEYSRTIKYLPGYPTSRKPILNTVGMSSNVPHQPTSDFADAMVLKIPLRRTSTYLSTMVHGSRRSVPQLRQLRIAVSSLALRPDMVQML